MTRFSALFLLASFSASLFGQADWQGDVKQLYKIDVPSFMGQKPVYGLAKKSGNLPDIELYSLTLKPAPLKGPVDFFKASLEKQGFQSVKATSGPMLEKVEMLNAARKLTAVVVASKQSAQSMLVGITVLPSSGMPKQ